MWQPEGPISDCVLFPGYARPAIRSANAACKVTGITPHRLRGTFATLLSEEGVPIQTIQKVMRHKNPMTTMNYLEVSVPTAARAMDRIGERIWGAVPSDLRDAPTHSPLAPE
ncbi:MAG: site-specific integrase [Pseudomonadota bacterium]